MGTSQPSQNTLCTAAACLFGSCAAATAGAGPERGPSRPLRGRSIPGSGPTQACTLKLHLCLHTQHYVRWGGRRLEKGRANVDACAST